MHFEFDEKIDRAIQKSVKSAVRLFKDRRKLSQGGSSQLEPPEYEEFVRVIDDFMASFKRADLNKLRSPSLRELYERAWAQKLRNYAIQREMREAYEALVRRY